MAELDIKTLENTKALSACLERLHSRSDICDVVFEVGPRKESVSGSGILLAARSRIFQRMILDKIIESQGKKTPRMSKRKSPPKDCVKIVILRYEKKDFLPLVQFAHCGKCEIESRYVIGLFASAREFEFQSLAEACFRFILRRTTADNVCYLLTEYWRYRLLSGLNEVKKALSDFASSYAGSIFQFCAHLTLPRVILQEMLVSAKLASEELTKFRACLLWCKHSYTKSQNGETGFARQESLSLAEAFQPFLSCLNLTKIPVRSLVDEVRLSSVVPERLIAHACAHNNAKGSVAKGTPSEKAAGEKQHNLRPPSLLGNADDAGCNILYPRNESHSSKQKEVMMSGLSSTLLRIPKANRTLKSMSKLALSSPCLEGLI